MGARVVHIMFFEVKGEGNLYRGQWQGGRVTTDQKETQIQSNSMETENKKSVYICGPLTELSPQEQQEVKSFYAKLADVCKDVTGIRAFVPHEHYDPVQHAYYTPAQVDAAERKQVSEQTSLLLVVTTAPSWGGGIEVEIANTSSIPVIILCERMKLEQRRISRLLRGNPAVVSIIPYDTEEEVFEKLQKELKTHIGAPV